MTYYMPNEHLTPTLSELLLDHLADERETPDTSIKPRHIEIAPDPFLVGDGNPLPF